MGPRTNLSITLIVAGAVLLLSIAVGNEMGNRVLGQATERGPAILATPVATPTVAESNPAAQANWRRVQVVTVATDPAFPDPRITPEPPPPPRPATPRPPTPKPSPAPTPTPRTGAPYTSPPLPIPLVTHGGEGESPAPAESPTEAASPLSGGR
jgi:outer membrane biosynthesis protein TonB